MSLKEKAFSGVKWTTISTIIIACFQTSQLVILARLLDTKDFGVMGMVTIVIRFTDIFMDMGISNAIIQKNDISKEDLSSLYWFNIMMGCSLALIIFLGSPLIAMLFNEPRLINLIRWGSVILVIVPIGLQYRIVMQKELRFTLSAKSEVTANVIGFISTISFAYAGFGVLSLIWGQIIVVSINTIMLYKLGSKFFKPDLYFKFSHVKEYLRFGIYKTGEIILNFFNVNVDSVSIGRMLGAQALGIYNVAFNLIIIPSTRINPIINQVMYPVLSKMGGDEGRMKENFYKLLTFVGLINFPIFFGMFITAPYLIPVVFGLKWSASIPLLQIMCGVGLMRSLDNPVGVLLMAKGKVDRIFNLNLVKLSFQIPGIILSAYFFGATGVAYTFLVLQCLFNVLGYKYLICSAVGPSSQEYFKSVRLPFLCCIPMSLSVLAVQFLLTGFSQGLSLSLQILTGAIVFFTLLLFSNDSLINELRGMIMQQLNKGKKQIA